MAGLQLLGQMFTLLCFHLLANPPGIKLQVKSTADNCQSCLLFATMLHVPHVVQKAFLDGIAWVVEKTGCVRIPK